MSVSGCAAIPAPHGNPMVYIQGLARQVASACRQEVRRVVRNRFFSATFRSMGTRD